MNTENYLVAQKTKQIINSLKIEVIGFWIYKLQGPVDGLDIEKNTVDAIHVLECQTWSAWYRLRIEELDPSAVWFKVDIPL